MKKSYIMLVPLVAAAIYFYLKKSDKINQTEAVAPILETYVVDSKKITANAEAPSIGAAPPPQSPAPSAAPVPAREHESITYINPDGSTQIRLDTKDKRVSDAKIVIERREDLEVDAEFAQLDHPDFKQEFTKLLSGTFADAQAGIEIAISSEKKEILSGFSCFADRGLEVYGYDGLALKTNNQNGYGVLQINKNNFARLQLAFDPSRRIYGRLYRRDSAGRWRQVNEFTAVEVHKKLKQCYKTRYQELNNR